MGKREAFILILIGTFLLLLNLGIVTQQYIVLFVGLGFLTMYFFSKEHGLVIPGFIVTAVGAYNVLSSYYHIPSPLFLVFLGAAFLLIFLFERRCHFWAIYPGISVTLVGAYRYIDNYTDFGDLSKIVGPILLIVIGGVIYLNSSRGKRS